MPDDQLDRLIAEVVDRARPEVPGRKLYAVAVAPALRAVGMTNPGAAVTGTLIELAAAVARLRQTEKEEPDA